MRKTTTWSAALCAALLALHVVGCEHDSGSVAVESVTVNPPVLTLKRGVTERVTATVLPDNADDKTVTWRSSDPSFATVNEDGFVTAHKVGTAIITARAGGKEATCAVTVPPASVESLSFDKDTLLLSVGTTGSPGMAITWDGIPDETVTPTFWWSSEPSVATVNDWGMVTAIAEGTAIISVQMGDKTATCAVTVQPEPVIAVESVTIDPPTLTLMRESADRLFPLKGYLSATVTPENADYTKAWSSSDPSVATVDDWGEVTPHKTGTATVTVQAGGKTATCAVTVTPIPVEAIRMDGWDLTLTRGTTGRITVRVTPADADATVRWSSSDPSVATVSDDGTVTAVKAGSATITAEAGGKTVERKVTVNPIRVERITLVPERLKLMPGMTRTVTATVTPDDADDTKVTWSSDDPSVATVNEDGTVTAHKLGTTNINAVAGGYKAWCSLTVSDTLVEVKSVTLNKDDLTLTRGKTEKLTATVTPDDADNKTVAWSSDKWSVATVADDGTVTAVGQGEATITARADGKEAKCYVSVKPIYVENVTLNKDTLTLTRGETETLTATISPDDADYLWVIWLSSDPSVATVGSDGKVTAVKAGTATITARADSKEATCEATCAVTVNPIRVGSVSLNKRSLTLTRGETGNLTATVTPGNADDTKVTWSSSDPSVATVDSGGEVTAVKAGTAIITARADGKEATCAVTVNPIRVERVTLNKATLTLTLMHDETGTLTATVTPGNADDTKVTWSSSNPSVATVSNDGTVTAVKKGTAVITARADGKEATCAVTVNPIYVESVTLNTTSLTLARGKTGTLTATVAPKDADDTTVTWSSSNPSVATVGNDGTVTAHKLGTATITAQAGDKTATCTVSVNPTRVERVTLNKTTLTLARGKTGTLTATVMPDDADDTTVTWSSSNPSVATVGNDGTVTAYKFGTATITAQADGKTATCTVSVRIPTMTGGTIDDNGVLTKYSGNEATVDIPDGVTGIGERAFKNCTDLTDVTIPDSVTSIGASAFAGCTDLTNVTIPDGVTSIGNEAFWNCESLTSVTIPGSVTSIGYEAFGGRSSERMIAVRYGGTLADWCNITWGSAYANPLSYPNSVLYIGDVAVRNAVIPNSVTEIKDYAFYAYTDLMSVTIPNSVTSIGNYAFYRCTNLTDVTIPDSVTSIGNYAFYRCTNLTDVTIPDSVTSIGWDAFCGCTGLTSVTIPSSVTSIGRDAFASCTGLTSVTIPGSVTSIRDEAFYGCRGLTSVTIPDGVTSIGESAFASCTGLTSVTIPNSVTSIGYKAFWNCERLTSVTIPGSVTSIGPEAFKECTSLTSVTIPDSVTRIGVGAFRSCTSLTSVTIPDSVTGIEAYAFYGCTGLTSVTIPDSVTSIENFAFYGCSSLTSVTIPSSVTSIKANVFGIPNKLTDVHYEGTKEEWDDISIYGGSGLSGKTITGKDADGNATTWTAE